MIIGDNENKKSFNINTDFQKKIKIEKNPLKDNQQSSVSNLNYTSHSSKKNVFTKDIFSMEGGNTSNSDEIYTKSIAMLNDRLEKGLITMDEFSKKCNDIAKKRNN